MTDSRSLSLTVRHIIDAAPARVFAAWVEPRHVLKWWGPKGVVCTEASIDLKVGGKYRIGNRLPDGSVLSIVGEYEEVSPPDKLVFQWRLEGVCEHSERVTVDFLEREDGRSTEVVVTHERIADQTMRDGHEAGWNGCLQGLDDFVTTYLQPAQ